MSDPQSTVPVEPLSAGQIEEARALYGRTYGADTGSNVVMRLIATLDAARASQPITATAREAAEEVVRRAQTKPSHRPADEPSYEGWLRAGIAGLASRLAALDDPVRGDQFQPLIDDLHAEFDQGHTKVAAIIDRHRAALPVREDEPTGIDVERLARALDAYAHGQKAGPSPWARLPEEVAPDLIAEYDRLTREASHVR